MFYHLKGCFVPAWLMSRSEISHSAKLAYVRVAQKADPCGVAWVSVPVLSSELGDDEERVSSFVAELEEQGLFSVTRHPSDAGLIRCHFPRRHRRDRAP